MTSQVSNAELGRRIDKIASTLEELPDRLAQTYLRQDTHAVVHDYLNEQLREIREGFKAAETERVTNRRFRIGVMVTLLAGVLGALIGLAANLH